MTTIKENVQLKGLPYHISFSLMLFNPKDMQQEDLIHMNMISNKKGARECAAPSHPT